MFPAQQKLQSSVALTYIAELVDTFAHPDEPSELVYRLLDKSCAAILSGSSPAPVVAYFELWILKLGGIFPSIRECVECHEPLELPLAYDHARGGFVDSKCSGRTAERVPNDVSRLLGAILEKPMEEVASEPIRPEDLVDLRAFSARLRRDFLGHELKSYEMLQAVLKIG